jgi:hypothetical protein
MKELVLPVPETVSATYTVPVPSPVSTAEARQLASEAVETRLTGPLRTLTAEWGGTFAIIGLRFDPAQGEDSGGWLTVCPPASWDTSWEDFTVGTCHGMFGFEKPRWHYMPEFGAPLDALDRARQMLPEARSRFLRGDLPPGGRLMVRYETPDTDEFQWARVESWEDSGHAVVLLDPACTALYFVACGRERAAMTTAAAVKMALRPNADAQPAVSAADCIGALYRRSLALAGWMRRDA